MFASGKKMIDEEYFWAKKDEDRINALDDLNAIKVSVPDLEDEKVLAGSVN